MSSPHSADTVDQPVPWLSRAIPVRRGELAGPLLAFAYFFFLLGSYYVLRPVREEMGVQGGHLKPVKMGHLRLVLTQLQIAHQDQVVVATLRTVFGQVAQPVPVSRVQQTMMCQAHTNDEATHQFT